LEFSTVKESEQGSSATDSLSEDVTDVWKKEEGSSATDSLGEDVTDVTDVRKNEEGRMKNEEGRMKKEEGKRKDHSSNSQCRMLFGPIINSQ
jgi:hypothetical protein